MYNHDLVHVQPCYLLAKHSNYSMFYLFNVRYVTASWYYVCIQIGPNTEDSQYLF